jgi:hypothetical protein
MAIPTIQPGQIKTGPGRIYYAPLATAIPTLTAAASKIAGTWTSWLEVGATDEGLTFSESTDTEEVRVAESLYPVRTQTTGKSGSVAFSMSHISDLNWKLAANGGTIVITGTGATKLSVYVPPLAGSENRIMLGFLSLDDDEAIVWPQVFNTEGFETARSGFADKHVLPVTFSVELPDPAVLTTPYKRWVTGNLAQGV